MTSTLELISCEPDDKVDWKEFKKRFTKKATFVMIGSTLGNPKKRIISWSIDEFATKAGPQYEERGFSEVETG
ncbi:MAG: hypothetical protein ACI9G9_000852 [Psychromonas sp.]|jgi:hypothetical protein